MDPKDIQHGGPAFPLDGPGSPTGMTLRDYFAAKAMQALITSNDLPTGPVPEWIGGRAYAFADDMLRAREAS